MAKSARGREVDPYERAPVGLLTLDGAGVIRELNAACASLLGKQRGQLRGRALRACLAPSSRAAFDAHLHACLEGTRPRSVELSLGARGVVQLVSALPAGRRRAAATASIPSAMLDGAARARASKTAGKQLKAMRRVKQDFLAVVSHELRTPLTPMMLWVRALRDGVVSEVLRARAVEAIDTCLRVQVAMIDDLLEVARGQHGRLRLTREPMDLEPVVGAAVETLAPVAAAKQIEVKVDAHATPALISGDATRMQQVVTNLLSNAIKFTPEEGHVAVSLRTEAEAVVLTVTDDGEGMEPGFIADVFEPFRQHDGVGGRQQGGLGLGLTIVRQLVVEHGGEVMAASAGKGRGACFTVTLPRLAEASLRLGSASPWTLVDAPPASGEPGARPRPLPAEGNGVSGGVRSRA